MSQKTLKIQMKNYEKDNLIRDKTRNTIIKIGGICTLTKTHSLVLDSTTGQVNRLKIGNNGYDGIGSIKIEDGAIKFIVKCVCKQTPTDVSALQGVLTRYPDHIGLMVVATQALEEVKNLAKISEQTILVIEFVDLKNLKDILTKTEIITKTIIECHTEETIYKGYKRYHKGNLIEEAREKRKVITIQKKHTGVLRSKPFKRIQNSTKRVISKDKN
ncbi:8883_t:CDS:1 [Funneliformis mosseae]|uniref:8883_t:CDS:1 n=1 Tax=Funneliformis mosseae TaxID=27381 RepID=A0A9N9G7K6_FUNMO|nr:8883_t:CDS:1 [Funneliformis mosseae]